MGVIYWRMTFEEIVMVGGDLASGKYLTTSFET